MFGSKIHRCALLIALLCGLVLPDRSVAQSAAARKDSLAQLRLKIEEFKVRIAFADSMGDAREGARQRIILAPLCKRAQALKLYEEAALIADTADLFEDEELRARQGLVELYQASGSWRKANEEAARVIVLTEEWGKREAERAIRLERSAARSISAQRDSSEGILAAERAQFAVELNEMHAREERWRRSAWIGGGACVLMFAFLLLLMRRDRTNARSETQALRNELASLGASLKPPPVGMPDPAVIERVPAEVIDRPIPVRDEVLLGMFRKRAPERLSTLRDARARDDHEKVARVVHTLKPQLIAIDAALFEELCAGITAKDAANDGTRWNRDLDRLEEAVEQLLK